MDLQKSWESGPDDAFSGGLVINMMSSMQKTVEGVKSMLGTAATNLLGNFQTNAELVQTVNSIIEQFVLKSLEIDCRLVQEEETVRLEVCLKNSSQFQLTDVMCYLTVHADGTTGELDANGSPPDADLSLVPRAEGPCHKRSRTNKGGDSTCSNNNGGGVPTSVLGPSDLQMYSSWRGSVCLRWGNNVFLPKQYHVLLEVRLPSPGSGVELSKTHTHTIQVTDQCTFSHASGAMSDVKSFGGRTLLVDGPRLRQLCRVPPTEGLTPNTLVLVTHKCNELLELLVQNTTQDDFSKVLLSTRCDLSQGQEAMVAWLQEELK
ncbi:Hypp5795 [Branchiostoma lanceolatum]|uniref:Hypp5795 protein n=1 Tax=Branchiostoma lanceolatum TaxID=7740 RepID=A0A8J9VFH0_BRALA|nr:Hypp5795 [Branchiostoma lanceolatum]